MYFIKLLYFLRKKGALNNFLDNTKEPGLLAFAASHRLPPMFLMSMFVWSDTPQGEDYWRKLQDEYLEEIAEDLEKELTEE